MCITRKKRPEVASSKKEPPTKKESNLIESHKTKPKKLPTSEKPNSGMVTAKESRPEPLMSSTQKEKMDERTRDLTGRKLGDEDDSLATVPHEMPEYCAEKEIHFAKKIADIKESDRLRREQLYLATDDDQK